MRKKALLLTLQRENREMEELAFSLGHDIVAQVYQGRNRPDPETFLGSGKLEEARELAAELGTTTILVNADLKPGQLSNLVRFFEDGRRKGTTREATEVYDRTRVILEIFKERAQSPEARLQVELARLHYEMPLVKEAIHLARRGERPGFLAGGEYEVDQYYDMIKRRMSKIRDDLERIRRERGTRRKHRRRGGFHLVSLAGYTNAGKSSLLTALAGTQTVIENRYFSTLATTTRRVEGARREILLTDTVGFIEALPPWLVEAFHSTLEEIALADVILLVVDASDTVPEIRRKLRTSLRVLWEFQTPQGAPDFRRLPAPLIVVLNKADAVAPEDLEARIFALRDEGLIDDQHVAVSAKARWNLDELLDRITQALPAYAHVRARLPLSSDGEAVIARFHEITDVRGFERDPVGGLARLSAECRYEDLSPLLARIDAAGGSWESEMPPAELRGKETVGSTPDPAQPAEDAPEAGGLGRGSGLADPD